MARPTKYEESFPATARKLCKLGATDVEIADFFGVSRMSVHRWAQQYPEFCDALKVGKEEADERVARSLYHRAIGYTFDAVKIVKNKGEPVVRIAYREHVPPDPTSMIFWLKNRRPDEWRDKSQHEHTGKDGAPLTPAINVTIGSAQPAPSSEAG